MKTKSEDKALLLFSGGKDSILSACHLIANGYQVTLLSLNNGCMMGFENIYSTAHRLLLKYGSDNIKIAQTYSITGVTAPLMRTLASIPYHELGDRYPYLTQNQAVCLCCQSAMWITAIAYAKAKDIPNVAAGYKPSDTFCTGCQEYIERIYDIAKNNGLNRLLPVWNQPWAVSNDTEARNAELKLFGFLPKTQEAHCVLGHHIAHDAVEYDDDRAYDMKSYFDEHIQPVMQDMIDHMIPVFRNGNPKALIQTEPF